LRSGGQCSNPCTARSPTASRFRFPWWVPNNWWASFFQKCCVLCFVLPCLQLMVRGWSDSRWQHRIRTNFLHFDAFLAMQYHGVHLPCPHHSCSEYSFHSLWTRDLFDGSVLLAPLHRRVFSCVRFCHNRRTVRLSCHVMVTRVEHFLFVAETREDLG
jgi:hypothetical protein